MRTITVAVTHRDIAAAITKRGQTHYSTHCPVARAIKRRLKGWSVWVLGSHADIKPPRSAERTIRMPPFVEEFISNFDNNAAVRPFKFRLTLP